jgi:hypothetical protein
VICLRCGRDARVFVTDPDWLYPRTFCSYSCMEMGQMVDPTDAEKQAIQAAGVAVGQYLEEVGQTDLAKLTGEQFDMVIEVAVTAYTESLQAAPPF